MADFKSSIEPNQDILRHFPFIRKQANIFIHCVTNWKKKKNYISQKQNRVFSFQTDAWSYTAYTIFCKFFGNVKLEKITLNCFNRRSFIHSFFFLCIQIVCSLDLKFQTASRNTLLQKKCFLLQCFRFTLFKFGGKMRNDSITGCSLLSFGKFE